VATVPLTDAGLTSYHAIKRSLAHLGAGSTAVVIGTGGLGHVGIQLLRLLTPARIIALDLTQDKLDLALKVGAHDAVLSDANAVANVRELLGGQGARAVFDFVGMQPTHDTAMGVADPESNVTIVGLGDGSAAARVGMFAQPYEVSVATIYWGSRGELIELVELARSGVLDVHVEKFSLEDAPKAYERLRAETLIGRAVVVP
jgi:propanol-preferring alcohol dehydrogenase